MTLVKAPIESETRVCHTLTTFGAILLISLSCHFEPGVKIWVRKAGKFVLGLLTEPKNSKEGDGHINSRLLDTLFKMSQVAYKTRTLLQGIAAFMEANRLRRKIQVRFKFSESKHPQRGGNICILPKSGPLSCMEFGLGLCEFPVLPVLECHCSHQDCYDSWCDSEPIRLLCLTFDYRPIWITFEPKIHSTTQRT